MIRKNDALEYHRRGRQGKIEVVPTKPLVTQRDLSLAYTPGVAEPCLEIAANPEMGWEYTARGNLVAVVTNGTAVLGLGNIGPLAGKPVMEGKACLFKKFADIDVFDLEVDETRLDKFVDIVAALEPTFGGINLEDIKAPECFEIEAGLRERMRDPGLPRRPARHRDHLGRRRCSTPPSSRARSSATSSSSSRARARRPIACVDFYVAARRDAGEHHDGRLGGRHLRGPQRGHEPVQGAVRAPRRRRAHARRRACAAPTCSWACRRRASCTRRDAEDDGASARSSSRSPTPIRRSATPRRWRRAPTRIVATGRSRLPEPGQQRARLPVHLPRRARRARQGDQRGDEARGGARARRARARAGARQRSPRPTAVKSFKFGPDYFIPKPFDTRVLWWFAPAVAKAAMESGAARLKFDLDEYRERLQRRIGGTQHTIMRPIVQRAKSAPKRIVFPDGDNIKVLRACQIVLDEGIARPILLGARAQDPRSAPPSSTSISKASRSSTRRIRPSTPPTPREYLALRYRKGVTALATPARLVNRRIYFGMMMVRQRRRRRPGRRPAAPYPDTIRPALQILGMRPGVRRASRHVHDAAQERREVLRRHDGQHRPRRRDARRHRHPGGRRRAAPSRSRRASR